MNEDRPTTNWPWLVAGGMFELRAPINVVAGYTAILERSGPLTEQQRSFLQQIQQTTRRISQIVEALAGLASLEGAWSTSSSRKESVSLRKLLSEVADHPLLQNAVRVDVRAHGQHDEIIAAPRLLCRALAGLALRVAVYQLVEDKRSLSIWIVDPPAALETWIVLAPPEQIQEAVKTPRESLTLLDEGAGPVSMDLPFAGAIVRAHGGQLLGLPEGTPGAVVALPRPTGASG
jgi:light-regulated signal transduction histidine kinase (bacteriophytochrome)